jgi:hypothetical protein
MGVAGGEKILADRVVHIGAPKCGSTALQSAFFQHRVVLRAKGIAYIGKSAHWIKAVKAVVQAEDRLTGTVPPLSEWRRLVEEVRRASGAVPNGVTALVSSEWFAGATDEQVNFIASELDASRMRVVLVIRPLTSTLPAAWQQRLQLGEKEHFSEWLKLILEKPEDPRAKRHWSKHRYDLVAQRWANVIGADRVTVVVADEQRKDFIYAAFENILNVTNGVMATVPNRTNPSLSAFEADTLAELNRIYFEHGGSPREYREGALRTFDGYVNSLRSGAVERTVIPAEHLGEIQHLNATISAGIRATGCQVLGNLDQFAGVAQNHFVETATTTPPLAHVGRAQRETDVRSAAGMIYALMVTTGVANPLSPLPGFGGRGRLFQHQLSSLVRRLGQLIKIAINR